MVVGVDQTLLGILHKILVQYLPDKDSLALCNTIHSFDPSHNLHYPCVEGEREWWKQNGPEAAGQYILNLTTDADGLKLLGFAGTYDPLIQSCPFKDLNLEELEYLYLWNTPQGPFCKVRTTQGEMYYTSIAHAKFMADIAIGQTPLQNIVQGFFVNLLHIDFVQMRNACKALSYDDMSNSLLADLCGCYIALPQPETTFSSDERNFLELKPECTPSCLDARINFVSGQTPISCQQNVCIADHIDVSTHTTISQICNQCNHKFQCVCYIHVNGQLIDNKTCNTVYTVDGQGNITSTLKNSPESAKNVISKWWDILKSSHRMILIVLVVITVLILLTIILLFVYQRRKHGTFSVSPQRSSIAFHGN